MIEDFKRIVEVNGIKVEIDLRTAKRVDTFKVGDCVKVLIKSYSDYKSYFGMIVGFDEFKSLPTIIVAYIDVDRWSEQPLRFSYINEKTEDVQICPTESTDIGLQKADINEQFDRQLAKKEEEIRELNRKKHYFINMFGKYFQNDTSSASA